MMVKKTIYISIALFFAFNTVIHSQNYFVATNGDDSNDGSITNPWKTVKFGVGQLTSGDTLNIREGKYYENNIYTKIKGTDTTPIIIQNYQNEEVTIDGGIGDFIAFPNTKWTLIDAAINLYKSDEAFSLSYLNAWIENENLHIIEYEDDINLKSTNYGPVDGFNPIYQGPGIYQDDNGYLSIRLEQNPNDLYAVDSNIIASVPSDINPNNNSINVSFSGILFKIDSSEYLEFKNINFQYSKYVFDIRGNSNNIKLINCKIKYGNYGILVRDGHTLDIENCEFDNGIPQYVYWTDVKNNAYETHEPYPEFQSKAISGTISYSTINNCYFHDGFDGIGINDGTIDTKVTNNYFVRFRDDALDLRVGLQNVEIAHNILWKIGSGISMATSGGTIGNVYIHHNIIDNSLYQHGGREGNYREDDWPIWTVIDPFGSHGHEPAWWKVYNNTIVTRKSGYVYTAAGVNGPTGNPEKYVLNNIFLVLDGRGMFRGDSIQLGSFYDGNNIFRYAPDSVWLFYQFGNGNNYNSLSAFQANSGTNWEQNGIEINPKLDTFAINNIDFDSLTIRERYRPREPQIYSLGASYDNYNWPETSNVYYRGALEPGQLSWLGHNTNWNDQTNWSNNIIPDEAYKVTIPTSPQYGSFPTINLGNNAKCYNILLENNAQLTVHGTLNVLK